MRQAIFVLAAMFAASTASAQITIPDEVPVGKPIVAGCECVVPEGAQTRVSWSLESRGDGVGEFIADSGSEFTIYVWAQPGSYRLTNSVVWVHAEEIEVVGVDGEPQKIRNLLDWGTANYEKTFTVTGGSDPEPEPKPKPKPKPEPDVPTDEWSLGKTIYTEVMKIPFGARAKSAEVADNFDAVSAGIAAGQFRNGGFSAASAELAERNRDTLGGDKGAWDAAFSELYRHMQERRVPTTLESYADAYTYIARGLRAVN